MIKINRFRSLLVILMTAALSVSFASCSDDKDDGNVSLEGTWTGETMKYQYILTFNADGTYYQEGNFVPQESTEDIKHDLRESGNYVVDGKKMTMTATMFQVYDQETDSWKDQALPEDEITLYYLFSIKGKRLWFYDTDDTGMKSPVMMFTKS